MHKITQAHISLLSFLTWLNLILRSLQAKLLGPHWGRRVGNGRLQHCGSCNNKTIWTAHSATKVEWAMHGCHEWLPLCKHSGYYTLWNVIAVYCICTSSHPRREWKTTIVNGANLVDLAGSQCFNLFPVQRGSREAGLPHEHILKTSLSPKLIDTTMLIHIELLLNRHTVCRWFKSLQTINTMQIEMLNVTVQLHPGMPLVMIAHVIRLCGSRACVTWCRTSRDSLIGCIPRDWSCQCPECLGGDGFIIYIYIYSSVCPWQESYYGSWNGGSPTSIWASHLSSDGREKHATKIEIVLAFWQVFDNITLTMFGTSS
jgi:hypothetical protein